MGKQIGVEKANRILRDVEVLQSLGRTIRDLSPQVLSEPLHRHRQERLRRIEHQIPLFRLPSRPLALSGHRFFVTYSLTMS
jgi:hypothetical protein